MKKLSIVLLIVISLGIIGTAAYAYFAQNTSSVAISSQSTKMHQTSQTSSTEASSSKGGISLQNAKTEVIAQNLTVPWEIAFLPNNDLLVTQRSGEIIRIGAQTKEIATIANVHHQGEGGLLGLALHPKFSQNNYIYVYFTTQQNGRTQNTIERYVLQNDSLSERTVILSGINGAANHDGGRIEFGPDGLLYVTTGDAQQDSKAQDTKALTGKILRITDEGKVPAGNPFNNEVYSYGHRNPQGLAWDDKGRLWASEHGPSGLGSGFDEINLIEAGKNYGWPLVTGQDTQQGLTTPVLQSGSDDTWAPADLAHKDGVLYFSGLRGSALYSATINSDGDTLALTKYFEDSFGRIRAVVVGPDGNLYISTSNTDGRGIPKQNDDKIIKIYIE